VLKRSAILLLILLALVACSSATPEPTATATPVPATPAPLILPTFTPMPVADLPALELLAGTPATCVNAEDYATVLSFQVRYYETTTANRVAYRMTDEAGNVIVEAASSGENKTGEEGWGFYPLAYEVPENSLLTIEVTVYATDAEDAPVTSRSILIYNCTTGATIETTFTRNP
jgi:hypothetical protein